MRKNIHLCNRTNNYRPSPDCANKISPPSNKKLFSSAQVQQFEARKKTILGAKPRKVRHVLVNHKVRPLCQTLLAISNQNSSFTLMSRTINLS